MSTMSAQPLNLSFKDEDGRLWSEYKRNPCAATRSALLARFDGVIQSQVNRWAGPLPRDVLLSEAKVMAAKALDSYNPQAGAALATHVTNALLPLSRIVYTHQNTARLPENMALRMGAYTGAVDTMKLTLGREPTTDELHSRLGWSAAEINRMRNYDRKNLLESGPAVSGDFFSRSRDDDDDLLLGGVYMELTPEEKTLFEHVTGYNGAPRLDNTALQARLGLSLAQVSYKKTLLRKKLESILARPGLRNRWA